MHEMESVFKSPLFQFVFSGLLVVLQLYFISVIKPMKKHIDKLFDAVHDIETKLNTLIGEHNERKKCR